LKYYKSVRDISFELFSTYFTNEEYISKMGQGLSSEIGIVQKLTEISNTLIEEAEETFVSEKLEASFNDLKTLICQEELNITKFEIQWSWIVEALYRLFCVPNETQPDPESGKVIIQRLTIFFKVMKEKSESFSKLFSNILDQSIHYNEFLQGQVSITNDVNALAHDLRKFGRRTKIQVIYDPDIEERIRRLEEEEKKQNRVLTLDSLPLIPQQPVMTKIVSEVKSDA
jgi:hypothetical protein